MGDDPDMGVLFEAGKGSMILVYKSGGAGTSQATSASFKVEDIESDMKDLRDKGVTFEDYDFPGLKTENGLATDKMGKAAWFKDSEGNILNLYEDA